jgi:hypothetical protein
MDFLIAGSRICRASPALSRSKTEVVVVPTLARKPLRPSMLGGHTDAEWIHPSPAAGHRNEPFYGLRS